MFKRITLPFPLWLYWTIRNGLRFHPNVHFFLHNTWCRVFSEFENEKYPKEGLTTFQFLVDEDSKKNL